MSALLGIPAMTDAETPPKPPKRPPVAVALRYAPPRDEAPRVVASGRGTVAQQILELAFAHGIKVREDPDLAELLALVEVDTEIPLEAFAAVAEILAYLYRANGNLSAALDAAETRP
jgi:flagellar biosynthesis protein